MEKEPPKKPEMATLDLREYLEIILKHKLIVFICFIIPVITITTYTLMQKPVYRALGKIEVFTGVRTPLSDVFKEYHHSRGEAEVLRGIDIKDRIAQKLGPWRDKIPKEYLEPEITVQTLKVTRMIEIWADSPYKDFARWYVTSMIEEYLAIKEEQRESSSDFALVNLADEMAQVNDKLKAAQLKLQRFREENPEVVNEEYERFSTHNMAALSGKIAELETKKKLIKRQIEALESSNNPSFWITIIDDIQRGVGLPESQQNRYLSKKEDADGAEDTESTQNTTPVGQAAFEWLQSLIVLEKGQILRWEALKDKFQRLKSEYAKIVNVYKPQHPSRIKLEEELNEVTEAMGVEVAVLLERFKEEYRSIELETEVWRDSMREGQEQFVVAASKTAQFIAHKGEVDRLQKLYDLLMKRANEVEIAADSILASVSVVEKPRVLPDPIRPNKLRNIMLSAFIGLGLGIGMAFFLEYIDDSVKSTDELKKYTGLTGLGIVHSMDWDQEKLPLHKITNYGESEIVETFRSIRTNILLSSPANIIKSILITSTFPSEGKTTTAVNTAIVLAQGGLKVLLIDGDLRRPTVHKFFDQKNNKGFSSVLLKDGNFEDCVKKTEVEGLDILTGGYTVPDPPKLFHLAQMREFLDYVGKKYDRIIIDSAPIFSVSDSVSLSDWVDGIIFVVHGAKTSRAAINKAKELLLDNSKKIIGAVINNLALKKVGQYYSYRYKYNYRRYDYKGKPAKTEKSSVL